jgi:ADP-heptose:LPS heptosyltransferase
MEHRSECLKHEADYNLNLLSPLLGKKIPEPQFDFQTDPELSEEWETLQNQNGVSSDYIIIHAGSGNSAPNLNLEQYQMLAETILQETGWQILLTGSPAEAEINQHLVDKISGNRIIDFSGKLNLVQLMECIRNARLLITSSTGPLHLADAQNTSVLGFFCPLPPHTPVRWGPYQQNEWVVSPDLKSPDRCRMKDCPYGGCLQQLSSSQIVEALEQRLKELN